MGRRVGGRGSQERAKGRVRGRVRERVQGGAGRRRGTLDVGAIEGYADRLTDHVGGASGLAGAASGLAAGGAAGGFAHRILGSNTEGSQGDLGTEVRERLDLVEERLQRLEDQMRTLLEGGADSGNLEESGDEPDPHSTR